MSENAVPANAGSGNNEEEFELLAAPPAAADLSGELKARAGAGISKVTLALLGTILAVGGFVGGIAVGKANGSSSSSSASKSTNAANPGPGGSTRSRGQFGQNGGRGTLTGTLQSVSGTTLTILDPTGKTVTVDTNDQTTVTIGKTGALSDLATGSQVTVLGTPESSGKITARSVLSGISGLGFGGGRGTRTPSPSSSATPTG